MKLYRTTQGCLIESENGFFQLSGCTPEPASWDALVTRDDLAARLPVCVAKCQPIAAPDPATILAPIGNQEVWAAGVTYYRSRNARMEESKSAGGGDFYDRVYSADRPELFFKATPHRVVGPAQPVAIRSDASWSVPEPELTLVINARGR